MISSAIKLFLLRPLPFSRFAFSRWKSVLAVTLVAFVFAVAPDAELEQSGEEATPLWITFVGALATHWTAFLTVYIILCWWLRRGDRWDGRGDYFNLLATSWLVPDLLAAYLPVFGIHSVSAGIVLMLYSFLVTIRATRAAIPGLHLGYLSVGIVFSVLVMIFAGTYVDELVGGWLAPEVEWEEIEEGGVCNACGDHPWYQHAIPAVEI